MTNNEFKAWFEGFAEGINGTPTANQWTKIVDKVKLLGPSPAPAGPIYRGTPITPGPTWPLPLSPDRTPAVTMSACQ